MRYAAILQTNWDWRAAANFMLGGGGGALLLVATVADRESVVYLFATLFGLALVGVGLLMVWLEIGRPWRAANVVLKPQNSWMTREAYVAGLAFVLAMASLTLRWPWLPIATGVAGFAFLYCQGRILRAAKGVPAWREPAIVQLIMATGLAEGFAYLVVIKIALSDPSESARLLLAALLLVRLIGWRVYRGRLLATDPPPQVKAALANRMSPFVLLGHFIPLLLLAVSYLALPFASSSSFIAAVLVVFAGWWLKFVLVTRLAHVQGFGLGKLRRGHPLSSIGHHSVSQASARLRKTRQRDHQPARPNTPSAI